MLFPQHNSQGLRLSSSRLLPSIERLLEQEISLNGVVPATQHALVGGQAAQSWSDYRGNAADLALQTGTAATLGVQSPLHGPSSLDAGVTFPGASGGAYYKAPNNTDFDLGNGLDVVSEALVFADASAGNKIVCGKRLGNVGHILYHNSSEYWTIQYRDASQFAYAQVTNAARTGALTFLTWCVDPNNAGGVNICVNGVKASAADPTAVGNVTVATPFLVGREASTPTYSTLTVFYLGYAINAAGWLPSSNLDDALLAYHMERMQRLCGSTWRRYSYGSAVASAITRAQYAAVDRYVGSERQIFWADRGLPAFVERQDTAGQTIHGTLHMPASSNKWLNNRNPDTSCTKVGIDSTGSAEASADGGTSSYPGVEDSADSQHGYKQTVNVTGAKTISFGGMIKKKDRGFLFVENESVANGAVWFDLDNWTVETQEAGVLYAAIEGPFVNDNYWIDARWTAASGDNDIGVYAATADNSKTYQADGSDAFAIDLVYCGNADAPYFPTATGGAAVTKIADVMTFPATDNVGDQEGTVRLSFLSASKTPSYIETRVLFAISDGGANGDRVLAWIDSSGYVNARIVSTEGEDTILTGALNVLDGRIHRLLVSWRDGDFFLSVDGSDEAYSAISDPPNDLDEIDIGHNNSSTFQPECVIADFDISAKYTPRMLRGWQ